MEGSSCSDVVGGQWGQKLEITDPLYRSVTGWDDDIGHGRSDAIGSATCISGRARFVTTPSQELGNEWKVHYSELLERIFDSQNCFERSIQGS